MKIVVFGPEKRTGVLTDDGIVDICHTYAKYLQAHDGAHSAAELAAALAPADLAQFIDRGSQALDNAQTAVDFVKGGEGSGLNGEVLLVDPASTKLHAPKPNHARIACAGGNFADHAEAMAARSAARGEMRAFEGSAYDEIRKMGIWGFWKVHRELVPPEGEIIYPARAKRLDYEGELAIVLGKQGKNIKPEDAADYVWGVSVFGDWSIRLMAEPGPMKFAMQKNFDTSCSLGPCIVVGEVDPLAADVETRVNGEVRQSFNTRDMVFSFAEYLEFLSKDFTLYPGDIVSGGTAAGTAADSSPLLDDGTPSPETFLNVGDTVEVSSPGVGTIRAKIVAE